MSEATIDVPAVGRVKKQYVIAAGGLVVVVVGYAYWRAGQAPAEDIPAYTEGDVVTDGVTDTSGGAAGGSANSGGGRTDSSTTPDTDAEWSMQATEALAGEFEAGALSIALGRYVTHQGLNADQQNMVRAAIGKVGYPPGGQYPVTADTSGTPSTFNEPTGLKASAVTSTSVTLEWSKVTGASGYRLFRSDLGGEPIGDSGDTKAYARGLQPNKSYTFTVAARTATGATGPKSQPLTVKTAAVKLTKPATPTVTGITKTTAKVTTKAVAGATGYKWEVNGVEHGASDAPTYTLRSLKANTTYKVSVRADTSNQGPGPESPVKTFKTKK